MRSLLFVLCCGAAPALCADGLHVASGVTFEPGLPKNGGIATAFLADLRITGVVAAHGAPLPLSIEGITVDVCGIAAPLYAVADLGGYQQVNFQVPWDSRFRFDGEHQRCLVTVSQGSFQASQDAAVRRHAAADLFFTPDYLGVIQHGTDYSLVTRQHPALPGEDLVLYAAALPQTHPAIPTGAAAPSSPVAVVAQYSSHVQERIVSIRVGSPAVVVRPFFVGLVPGYAGLYQLNFRTPDSLGAGDHELKVALYTCGPSLHGTGCASTIPPTTAYSNPVILPVGQAVR